MQHRNSVYVTGGYLCNAVVSDDATCLLSESAQQIIDSVLCGPPATAGGGIPANTKQCSVVVSEIFSILLSGDDVLSIASNLCFNIIQVIYHN